MELDDLGSAESFTITATRLPGGKFSVRSDTSQIETVILAGQVLELRMRGELLEDDFQIGHVYFARLPGLIAR